MSNEIDRKRNQVVVHYIDGKLLKGYTHDFTPVKETFHLTSELKEDKGQTYEIKTDDLKAVFFVKTMEGNKGYYEKKRFDEVDTSSLRGMKIKVEFFDGEIIRGTSLGYNKNKKGFFIIPVDPQGNNERIFVIAAALKDIKLGSAADS